MVDDGVGVIAVQRYARRRPLDWRGAPWRVNPGGGRAGEFGDPAPDVVAVRIEFFALQNRVENAEIGRGVGARAHYPLPVRGVVGGVGVAKRVPKPLLAEPPI